jgi:ribonuclease P protein component
MSGPENTEPRETRRLKKRREFTFVRDGVTERRKSLVIQARARLGEAPGDHIGEGFTATKKVGGAVQRNRAKRRLREVFRLHQAHVPGDCDLLLIARSSATTWPLPELEKRFVAACRPGWDYVLIAREATLEVGWSRLLDDMESALISLARP